MSHRNSEGLWRVSPQSCEIYRMQICMMCIIYIDGYYKLIRYRVVVKHILHTTDTDIHTNIISRITCSRIMDRSH